MTNAETLATAVTVFNVRTAEPSETPGPATPAVTARAAEVAKRMFWPADAPLMDVMDGQLSSVSGHVWLEFSFYFARTYSGVAAGAAGVWLAVRLAVAPFLSLESLGGEDMALNDRCLPVLKVRCIEWICSQSHIGSIDWKKEEAQTRL